ncbi:hypothetical protein ACIN8IBEIGE_30008 [Acinetobacter sp. 8I-beige]|nr:hypothetical protein ACIN8IBEIGE_30008 [Acinetobacter sp. 8I-beige]
MGDSEPKLHGSILIFHLFQVVRLYKHIKVKMILLAIFSILTDSLHLVS